MMKKQYTILMFSLLFLSIGKMCGQYGMGTKEPNQSSTLDIVSTKKGVLLPRMLEIEMRRISTPAEGLIVYCKDCTPKGFYFFNGISWSSITAITTPSSKVSPDTGKHWLDKNLGATRVATSITDELSYGGLFQWGRRADGHQLRNSKTTRVKADSAQPTHGDFILNANVGGEDWWTPGFNDHLWDGSQGVNNPCPEGYRLPTRQEFLNEINKFDYATHGYQAGFYSFLKLPLAGRRSAFTGEVLKVGESGAYAISELDSSKPKTISFFKSINHNKRYYEENGYDRNVGISVRCIKKG